jgi:putative heme-binding domain-containing protein
LQDVAGRTGRIEIVDSHSGSAYAWLAAGNFSIPGLNPAGQDAGATAVALIKDFRLVHLEPRLNSLLLAEDRELRSHAASALVALKPDARVAALLLWADDANLPPLLHSRLWDAVRSRDAPGLSACLRELLVGAASDLQRKVADALVTDRPGAELLLSLAEEGRLSLTLLQQPALKFKLAVLKAPELVDRATQLTSSLPAPDLQLALLMARRKKEFDPANCSPDNGKTAFVKRCAVCHQIGSEGAKIGPQLDGVGIRGIDRLLEDILDPNRNVDAAFRSSAIALTDGRILTGLKRREEGSEVVFANSEGKEFRIPAGEIEELKLSPTSLMPGNFGELVPEAEMADILAWLLTQKPAGK